MLLHSLVIFIKRGYKCRDLKVLHILTVCLYSFLSYTACRENAHITLSPVACSALPTFFHTISLKKARFSEIFSEHKLCVLIFCTSYLCDISYSMRDIIINVRISSCKVPVILASF
jgi:hypothetical protein